MLRWDFCLKWASQTEPSPLSLDQLPESGSYGGATEGSDDEDPELGEGGASCKDGGADGAGGIH